MLIAISKPLYTGVRSFGTLLGNKS